MGGSRLLTAAFVGGAVVGIVVVGLVEALDGFDGELPPLPAPSTAATGAEELEPPPGGEYVAEEDLGDLPDEAPGYELSRRVDRRQVQRLAAVLGVEGEVQRGQGLWAVSEGDRDLVVLDRRGVPWELTRRCPGAPAPGEAGLDTVACPPAPLLGQPLPGRQEATRLARRHLAGLDVEASSATVSLSRASDGWQATTDPTVGDLPTRGFATVVTIGPQGALVRAAGYLGEPEHLGDYPLAGVDRGLARLETGSPVPTGALPSQTVVAARLGLLHVRGFLVPAYLFELANGEEVAVPAVDDEHLRPGARAEPAPRREGGPDRVPSAPGPRTRPDQAAGGSCSTRSSTVNGSAVRSRLCVSPTSVSAGAAITAEVEAAGCGPGRLVFGDGNETAVEGEAELDHAYAEPGTYTVELTTPACPGGRAAVTVTVHG